MGPVISPPRSPASHLQGVRRENAKPCGESGGPLGKAAARGDANGSHSPGCSRRSPTPFPVAAPRGVDIQTLAARVGHRVENKGRPARHPEPGGAWPQAATYGRRGHRGGRPAIRRLSDSRASSPVCHVAFTT